MQTTQHYSEMAEHLVTERFVREPERKFITGTSRAHWNRLELAGRAPARIRISERIISWRLTDLQRWIALRIEGREWTDRDTATS